MAIEQTASLQGLYDTLAGGSTVRMGFANAKSAEHFRVQFTKYKSAMESKLIAIGYLDEDALQSFSFIRKQEWVFELKFRGKKVMRTYSFVVMDQEPNASS